MNEEKIYTVSLQKLSKIASEFQFHTEEFEGLPAVRVPSPKKVDIDDEKHCFDTFAAKDGLVYVSAPAIPLPMRVVEQCGDILIQVHPLTSDYGIVHKRQLINFERNIRFFLHEIVHVAFHYTSKAQQIPHPLTKQAD